MRNPALKQLQLGREDYRRTVQEFLAPHRIELLERQANWIRRVESWMGNYFIGGADVDVARIHPSLELVATDHQHAIWRYCRLWGTIPYNRGCGRLLRYLLRDEGQPGAPIMGILALSSPVLISKPRDRWIGWRFPIDSDLKRRRLLTCMDLSVSMTVPPYNHLTAGKMICLAALSNEVNRDYWDKFHAVSTPTGMREGRLALISTTSLYGSSVQYNRIKLDGHLAYQLVGYTSGFGNAHLTEAEFAAMEEYLNEIGRPVPKGWGTGRSYRLRVYSAYHRHRYGESHAPAHKHSRSVYVAPLAENTQPFMRGEVDILRPYDRPFDHLAAWWRTRWLTSRLEKPDIMERFRVADPKSHPLSLELEVGRS